jgi:endogenous inhibitor of DNA gyrase (YacG/DUF329 family)
MSESVKTVPCPICGKPAEWRQENKYRPFCSEHCKLIDLGEWAAENYRLPAQDNDRMDPSQEGRG